MAERKSRAKAFTPMPKHKNGTILKARVRELYFNSPHVEWIPFCRENGWDWRIGGPILKEFHKWKGEKKGEVLKEYHQDLVEKLSSHKQRWNKDVLEALSFHPEMNSFASVIIKKYWRAVGKAIAEEEAKEKAGQPIEEKERFYRKFNPLQLQSLARATKDIQESHYKSLLIDQFHIKAVESEADSFTRNDTGDESTPLLDAPKGGIEFTIMQPDGSKLKDKELAGFLASYYDKPFDPTHGLDPQAVDEPIEAEIVEDEA